MRIKQTSDTSQQNQPAEDQNPVVTISPVQTSSQVLADVDGKQDDLDAPDESLQVLAEVEDRQDDPDAPDGSLNQQVAKESATPHGSSILHYKVEVNVQVKIRCHTNI
ncbi:uncharacterized protein LOC122140664 isoform X2 [Cyprinus carpio]|uniref:Uncharacterized protein LOC122140664 isoform X2 n=1 Tax=Cyprinus carpio TaxID=7962 RepID=A0A9R0AK96_CYPCA|nr:uncharacterized protein LOC122140664 isoform X2 [Cyprinus carpio]